MGLVLLTLGRPAEARRRLRQARANQLEPAAREMEIAIRYQPDLAEAYYQLSRVYARLGENAKSQRALVAFSQLKKEAADESGEFMEDVRKQLELQ